MQKTYQERRDALIGGLRKVGFEPDMPKATFYVWCPVPAGYKSREFTTLLLREAGIVTTPGSGFGRARRRLHPIGSHREQSTHRGSRRPNRENRLLARFLPFT